MGDWKSLKEELSVPVWKETAGHSQTQKAQTTPLNRKSTKNRKVPKQLSGEELRHTPLNTLNQKWKKEESETTENLAMQELCGPSHPSASASSVS